MFQRGGRISYSLKLKKSSGKLGKFSRLAILVLILLKVTTGIGELQASPGTTKATVTIRPLNKTGGRFPDPLLVQTEASELPPFCFQVSNEKSLTLEYQTRHPLRQDAQLLMTRLCTLLQERLNAKLVEAAGANLINRLASLYPTAENWTDWTSKLNFRRNHYFRLRWG